MKIVCTSCREQIEVPPELLGDSPDITLLEPYVCDACETKRDDVSDDLDHEMNFSSGFLGRAERGYYSPPPF